MLEGEYELFRTQGREKAQQYYEEGLTLAKLLGHTFLSKKWLRSGIKNFGSIIKASRTSMSCFFIVIESIIETWKKLNGKGESHV